MAHDAHVEKVVSDTAGRYVARIDGIDGKAELTFTIRGPALISADHTNAPENMRGTGAAAALVQHMIADARTNAFKITPICPYVRAQYRRHPEWADVMVASNSSDRERD
jgi:predicted GNAT family acetyltransferase